MYNIRFTFSNKQYNGYRCRNLSHDLVEQMEHLGLILCFRMFFPSGSLRTFIVAMTMTAMRGVVIRAMMRAISALISTATMMSVRTSSVLLTFPVWRI